MINKKEKDMKLGQMGHITMVIILMERNKELVNSNGLMELNTKAVGRTIKWMEKEHFHGLMVVNILANTKTTKNMEEAITCGRIIVTMMEVS